MLIYLNKYEHILQFSLCLRRKWEWSGESEVERTSKVHFTREEKHWQKAKHPKLWCALLQARNEMTKPTHRLFKDERGKRARV